MLRTTKNMRNKYEKIQNYLFALIPEKWEAIYLYASVVSGKRNMQNGEMYFYYLPKGLMKRKPVNVYEVPKKFNISEEQYLKVVKDLYNCIKELKQDFIDTDQRLWTNLTITIANCKFKVEYDYQKLPRSEEESNAKHIIWRHKYLGIGGERKEEQRILDEYYSHVEKVRKEIYETGLYVKIDGSGIAFDTQSSSKRKDAIWLTEATEQETESNVIEEQSEEEKKPKRRNQILNI